eukprot:TRINITY_DN23089_c0_g1_i1.p1 TRINITY_DN23089_c0_g1~~TRINITY_DN23089_c0_g1_i1.p1  ORF type:complete len:657 (+),score=117.52 TRINITY_DN23089_c0_g1_i1:100-2070(+)
MGELSSSAPAAAARQPARGDGGPAVDNRLLAQFIESLDKREACELVGSRLCETAPRLFETELHGACQMRVQSFQRRRYCFGLWGLKEMAGFFLGLLGFILCLCFELSELYPRANDMLGITVLMAAFWVCEPLPLPVTALFPMVLIPSMGIMESGKVAASYWGWVQMLFIGAFLVDIAIERVQLPRRVALVILRRVGLRRPWVIMATFLLLAFVLSMFCSNTATCLMLLPFALGLLDAAKLKNGVAATQLDTVDMEQSEDSETSVSTDDLDKAAARRGRDVYRFEVGVLLSIAFGATSGGIATIIGTPPNGVLSGQPIFDGRIHFANWFAFAFPVSCVCVVIAGLTLYFLYLRGVELTLGDAYLEQEFAKLVPFRRSRDEVIVAIVQAVQIILWAIRPYAIAPLIKDEKGKALVNDAAIACFCAIFLFFIPSQRRPGEALLTWRQAESHLPWGVLILMGGGLALALGFSVSGLTDVIGNALGSAVKGIPTFWLVFAITATITFTTEVTSNTATANVLLPIFASVSWDTLIHPALLLTPVAVACSFAFMMPAATPPNMVVFATERIPILEMIRAGIFVNLGCIIFGTLIMYSTAGSVLDAFGPFPKYACAPENCAWLQLEGLVGSTQVSSQACSIVDAGLRHCRIYNGTIVENYTAFV